MSDFTSDTRAGDICVQLAHILDDTDPDKLILAVNDENGHIQKKWKMTREMFKSQFHEVSQQRGTYIKRVKIIEIDNSMVKFARLNEKGKKTDTHQSVSQQIFRQTYILESLANLPPDPEQHTEEEEIVELDQEI